MTGPIVRDSDGTRYVLEKRSAEASRVRNPVTGERTQLPNAELESIDGTTPLQVAAESLSTGGVDHVTGVADERSLGLLVILDARGPTRVRTLLDCTTMCERDLQARLASLTAGEFIEELTVDGERGYAVLESTSETLARLY